MRLMPNCHTNARNSGPFMFTEVEQSSDPPVTRYNRSGKNKELKQKKSKGEDKESRLVKFFTR